MISSQILVFFFSLNGIFSSFGSERKQAITPTAQPEYYYYSLPDVSEAGTVNNQSSLQNNMVVPFPRATKQAPQQTTARWKFFGKIALIVLAAGFTVTIILLVGIPAGRNCQRLRGELKIASEVWQNVTLTHFIAGELPLLVFQELVTFATVSFASRIRGEDTIIPLSARLDQIP